MQPQTITSQDLSWPTDEAFAQPRPGETSEWHTRFASYCQLGPSRSILAVYDTEKSLDLSRHVSTKRHRAASKSWYEHGKVFDWSNRAKAYDDWRRRVVFSTGNAQDTERIKKLDILIEKLHERCINLLDQLDMSKISAEEAMRVITALLSALDIMAKHTGSYAARKIEITGKDGKPIEVEETQVSVVFYMPEVDPIEDDPTMVPSEV